MDALILDMKNRAALSQWERQRGRERRQRKAEIRKHVFLLAFAVCFLFAAVFGLNRMISNAGAPQETELSFKYYKNIPVEQGDTLFSIAGTYADREHYDSVDKYVREVRLMNHLDEDDTIYAGDWLIIPYYSGEFY